MTEQDAIAALDNDCPWLQADYLEGPGDLTVRWLKAHPEVFFAIFPHLGHAHQEYRAAQTAWHIAEGDDDLTVVQSTQAYNSLIHARGRLALAVDRLLPMGVYL